jgi:hypothetical protein
MSLPQTIRALRTESNNQVKVVEVPFASRPDIKELGEDEIIVGLRPPFSGSFLAVLARLS